MREDRIDRFRAAGRTLLTFGLVKGSEGNLSVFDGSTLVITRTGCELGDLSPDDLIAGPLEGQLPGASSDLEEHRRVYVDRGPGAFAHCHPVGTVPEGWTGHEPHGIYAFGATLDGAVAECVHRARER